MSDLRQAAQQAADAWFRPHGINYVDFLPYMEALRAALAEHDRLVGIEAIEKDAGIHVLQQAEPEQEPDGISWLKRDSGYFTAPTPRKPLTDQEIDALDNLPSYPSDAEVIAFARRIEQAHGIK